jgi:peptidoglycan-associated lipoprotein
MIKRRWTDYMLPLSLTTRRTVAGTTLVAALLASACGGKAPPETPAGVSVDPVGEIAQPVTTAPPEPTPKPLAVPSQPVPDDVVASRTLDELNRDSPLKAIFFGYDSSELNPEAQTSVQANAAVLRMNSSWKVTIEGHCDERGTVEYNLALGDRRANAVKAYLVSLGIREDRLLAVSYGKEFPFDAGHDETAWATNRRGYFVVTAE